MDWWCIPMEINMMDFGSMGKNMDSVHIFMQMDLSIKGIGRTINRMEEEYFFIVIMIDMKVK